MEFLLASEIYTETGIVQFDIPDFDAIRGYFQPKNYSPDLKRIFVIFICRPNGHFQMRKRFYAEKGHFHADVMLDYAIVMAANSGEKKSHYLESFSQIYPLLAKYKTKIKDLKLEEFKNDLDAFLQQLKHPV